MKPTVLSIILYLYGFCSSKYDGVGNLCHFIEYYCIHRGRSFNHIIVVYKSKMTSIDRFG